MSFPIFKCAYEKNHNPPLEPEADSYYQQARQLEKSLGILDWPAILRSYQQAVDLNHWKAMNNLAIIYYKGVPDTNGNFLPQTGVAKDTQKTLELYMKMVELEVPIGYYSWAIALEQGLVENSDPKAPTMFMFKAASLGSPLAQVRLGNFFAYSLPKAEQRNDIAEQYFRCAGAQDNIQALLEVADFYDITKQNKPRAMYYYQKAASLGSIEGFMFLKGVFLENPLPLYDFGYTPNPELAKKYEEMYYQLRKDPELKFPNLIKDYPLPYHPIQGYDAANPDVRPEESI